MPPAYHPLYPQASPAPLPANHPLSRPLAPAPLPAYGPMSPQPAPAPAYLLAYGPTPPLATQPNSPMLQPPSPMLQPPLPMQTSPMSPSAAPVPSALELVQQTEAMLAKLHTRYEPPLAAPLALPPQPPVFVSPPRSISPAQLDAIRRSMSPPPPPPPPLPQVGVIMAAAVSPPPLSHGATSLDHWRASRGARRLNNAIEQSMSEIERSLSPAHQRGLAIVEPSPRARQVCIGCVSSESGRSTLMILLRELPLRVNVAVGGAVPCPPRPDQ